MPVVPECPPWLIQLHQGVREQIREQRATQTALADHLGITPQYLSQLLTGRVYGRPDLLDRIATAVGLRITVTRADTEPVRLRRDARGRWLRS